MNLVCHERLRLTVPVHANVTGSKVFIPEDDGHYPDRADAYREMHVLICAGCSDLDVGRRVQDQMAQLADEIAVSEELIP